MHSVSCRNKKSLNILLLMRFLNWNSSSYHYFFYPSEPKTSVTRRSFSHFLHQKLLLYICACMEPTHKHTLSHTLKPTKGCLEQNQKTHCLIVCVVVRLCVRASRKNVTFTLILRRHLGFSKCTLFPSHSFSHPQFFVSLSLFHVRFPSVLRHMRAFIIHEVYPPPKHKENLIKKKWNTPVVINL